MEFKDWLSNAIGLTTLLTILFAVIKVVNTAQRGVNSHEDRLVAVEEQVAKLSLNMVQVAAVSVKIDDMKGEIERMRNRLDRFLDVQSESRA